MQRHRSFLARLLGPLFSDRSAPASSSIPRPSVRHWAAEVDTQRDAGLSVQASIDFAASLVMLTHNVLADELAGAWSRLIGWFLLIRGAARVLNPGNDQCGYAAKMIPQQSN